VRLEDLKAVLHRNEILTVVVLFEDLLVQTMVDATLEEVGVIGLIDFAC